MTFIDPGMPRRVLRTAQNLGGVHADCLVASDPCSQCISVVLAAFDLCYGHADSVESVLRAVFEDFRQDQIDDERGTP